MPAEEPLIEEHAFRQTTTRRRLEMAEEGEREEAEGEGNMLEVREGGRVKGKGEEWIKKG